MRYGGPVSPTADIRDGSYEDLKGADLVMITAGVNEKTGGATDRSDAEGRLKLLDANPRVWGWHTLGAAAGVDFSYLLWLAASGLPVPPCRARPGVRWVRASTDLPTVMREVIRGRLPLGAYLRTLRGPRERAIFALDDPLPGLAEAPLILSILLRRLARGDGL